jgi:hypothetical protein
MYWEQTLDFSIGVIGKLFVVVNETKPKNPKMKMLGRQTS